MSDNAAIDGQSPAAISDTKEVFPAAHAAESQFASAWDSAAADMSDGFSSDPALTGFLALDQHLSQLGGAGSPQTAEE